MTSLADYEGQDVSQTSIRITKAGDGLSEALAVKPIEFHLGDEVYVVLRTECVRISHEPIKDTADLRRVHTLAAVFGTVADRELVQGLLDQQRQTIEAAAGIQRLELDGDNE